MVSMNIITNTSSNLIDPDNPIELTPDSISEREYGSKMVLVVEQMQCLTIWLMKACLLVMYGRLTSVFSTVSCHDQNSTNGYYSTSLKQNIAVKAVAIYVAVGFVVSEYHPSPYAPPHPSNEGFFYFVSLIGVNFQRISTNASSIIPNICADSRAYSGDFVPRSVVSAVHSVLGSSNRQQ